MSDSDQDSVFNLGNIFGLQQIGDIGTAFSLFRRAINGEEISAADIPESMNSQILHMAMQKVGAENIDEFLTAPSVLEQIVSGLRENTLDPNIAAEDKLIVQHIGTMNGEDLQNILLNNPSLSGQLETIVQDIIHNEITAEMDGLTLGSALGFASANGVYGPSEESDNLDNNTSDEALQVRGEFSHTIPNELLSKEITDLNAEDFTALSNEQLADLIPSLPQDIFQDYILTPLNEKIDGNDIVVQENSSLARQEAFNAALNTLEAENSGLLASFAFATGLRDDPRTQVFDAIREGIPQALETLQSELPSLVEDRTAEYLLAEVGDAVTIENGQVSINFENFEPEQIQALFEQNSQTISEALTSEENWPMIESMILANNAELIRNNRDRIMEQMLPELTEQGLSQFQSLLNDLPPQFVDMLNGFLDWIGGLLAGFGINIGGPTSDASQSANHAQNTAEGTPPEPMIY